MRATQAPTNARQDALIALALARANKAGGGAANAFVQNGNAFAAEAVLGTTDNHPLEIVTNNVARAAFDTGGAFVPPTDEVGTVGTSELRWQYVYGYTVSSKEIDLSPGAPGLIRATIKWNASGSPQLGEIGMDISTGQASVRVNGATATLLNDGGNATGAIISVGTTDNNALNLKASGAVGFQIVPVTGAVNFLKVAPATGTNDVQLSTDGTAANVQLTFLTKGSGGWNFVPGADVAGIFKIWKAGAAAIVFSVDSLNSRVGIGTVSPSCPFQIVTSFNSSAMQLANTQGGDNADGIAIIFGNNTTSAGGATALAFIRPDATPIGTVAQTSAGTGVVYNTTSDERLKADIKPTTLGLELLKKIPVSAYKWKSDKDQRTHHGFIAQHLHAVVSDLIPNAVTPGVEKTLDGKKVSYPWMVSHGELVPLLVASVKELTEKVEALEAQLKKAS